MFNNEKTVTLEEKIQYLADNFKRNEVRRAINEYPVAKNNCEPWYGGKKAINELYNKEISKVTLEYYFDTVQKRGSNIEDDYEYWNMVTDQLSIIIKFFFTPYSN